MAEVKECARYFFESYGVPVIPVGSNKVPIPKWEPWQTETMTHEMFEGLPWDKSANFALVTGTKTKSDYYFCAIDVDKPIDYSLLPTTMMEETPRGGRHFYYISKHNCPGLKIHDVGIELLGLGQIVIIYHKWLNDNGPTPIDSIEAVFTALARALGKTELTRGRQPLTEVLNPQTEGNRNIAIFDLSTALRDKNVPYETALATALATNDKYTPPLSEGEVKTAVQSAYEHPLQITPEHETVTLQQVKDHFKNWLYLEDDDEVLDIVIAAACDRRLPGDPVWLFLLSASGGTKTEIVRNLCGPDIYTLDSLTPHTLISGKVEGNKAIRGILKQIDGKVLIIKDFTVMLNKRREDRDEIFSQLRSLHDGYIEHAFGSMPEPLRIPAKIGLIAACVPAIECYQRLYTILGERFLTVRHRPNRREAATKALANLGKEDMIRGELCGITTVFLKGITPREIALESNMQTDILNLADALACMRTPVPHGTFTQDGLETFTPSIEYPTRISKQLLKLAKLLALIRGKTTAGTAELATVKRVARDSCIQNRLKILDNLPLDENKTTRELSDAAKIPLATCWRDLKEMESLCLVNLTETAAPATDGWALIGDTLVSLTYPERRVGK